ncbi:MAG TPA: hypothetical protein PJ997_00880 [Candidatus Paceibacterota bacterium]|nr:hypothetical protein [Candidatus Paceibacterota bacterium]HMP18876.1 hypothetical protein [Candidatus Paceibacterota bacterium]HMP85037.1 hypothetical protein [Candidatus Paceibacterota bacterium]
MDKLDEKLEKEIIELLEFVLQPINGKFVCFENPITIYSTIRKVGDNKSIFTEENKIIFYHIKLNTKYGETVLSVNSDSLKTDINYAVTISCGHSAIPNMISKEEFQGINSNILNLYNKK